MSFNPADYISIDETTLPHSVSCHILHIANVAESREKSLEEWKYYDNPNTAPFERMEHVSRPVIYGIDLDATEQEPRKANSAGTYKLLLEDGHGHHFYAFEAEELPFLHPREKSTNNPLPVPLGGRLVLQKGTTVCEGMVMMRRHQCLYLGVDVNSGVAKQLNDGVVKKYIQIMER